MSDKEERAALEALRNFQAVTTDLQRAKILAYPEDAEPVDVTEWVVDLLDMIHSSMDWSSGFYSDTDKLSFIALCRLLKVEEPDA